MINFAIDTPSQIDEGVLVYRAQDYAFGVEPRPKNADSSLVVNTIELMVDRSNNQILFLEGYCPYQGWKRASLEPPISQRGALRISGVELRRGMAEPLNSPGTYWGIQVDTATGWVCVGNARASGMRAIEFARGCVAVLDDGNLVALWLRPNELPSALTTSE
jgi:hypothetical protein